MAKKRTTFSEHWYRVADMRPRLLPAVQTTKQFYRGREWHVVRSPMNQEFFRMDAAAYNFVALLTGTRTVAEAWKIVTERFGDAAPTQGEAIQLIGQMYTSNLLQAEIPPDSESIFQRYRKRRKREVQNTLMSFLFPRFKLFDPNRLLDRWVPLVGWLFIWKGFVAWGILILFGLHALAGNFGNLYDSSSTMLSPANLPLLYGAFVLAKAVHEAAHAFSCKFLGTFEMNSGSVHNTGIMLLLFTPAPYVDATSSWAFRNKWRRIMVSAAGIWAELALAAVAAVIWANTSDGIALHAVCHNLMFVASVSTFLFNGNPLLRYDAYFILCDFLEMPNLASRGKQYSEYLVKRYVWDVKEANHTANGIFEKFFFVAYTIASNVYRVFLLSGIVLTIADMAFFVGVVLALGSMAMWVLLPLGKFVRYLFSSPELSRVRGRAIVTTTVFIVGTALAIGGVPVRDNFLIEGVVEADNDRHIHAGCDGFLVAAAPSLAPVTGDETVVATLHNPSIETEWAVLTAREKELQANLRIAEARDPASIEVVQEQWLALLEEKARVGRLRDRLHVVSATSGVWVAPGLDKETGRFFRMGEALGRVLSPDRLVIRSVPGQDAGLELIAAGGRMVDVRIKGRADLETTATVGAILPGGRKELPSPALGFPAGGETAVDSQSPGGDVPEENIFEIRLDLIRPDWPVLPGHIAVIRFHGVDKPLAVQAWRSLLQLLQRRFHV